jgi:hypothetical protein
MDDELQRRLAANEAVFRSINEGIQRGQWPGDESRQVGFRCECAQLGCNSLLELTASEYEHVRANPRRFVMIADHHIPAVEAVIEHHDGYLVVEKRAEAGEHAETTDPRSAGA